MVKIPESPPALRDVLLTPERVFELIDRGISAAPGGRYYHWDKLRRLDPPDGLTAEEWWVCIKLARRGLKDIPLRDILDRPFKYALVDPVLHKLHEIDREAGSWYRSEDAITNPQTRDRYLISSLIEEAITSSQLEGAATTREVARDMLRSGRPPVDLGERMILNNYLAMHLIRELRDRPLTPELVYRIHGEVTKDTLPSTSRPPHLRTRTDRDVAVRNEKGRVLHQPPPADQIQERMEAMCAFANQNEPNAFLHPVLKAILLHFWLAYDHPFVDGNGRTARALFYWSMLSQDFPLFEFVSISTILKKAPAQYARAFLYTETDENDLTYFILHQMSVISRAIQELRDFLERKTMEVREIERGLRSTVALNHRQKALLSHALRHPGTRYTIDGHRKSHGVVYQTARTDLLHLARRRLLDKTRDGRAFAYAAPADLADRLKRLRK